MASEALEKAERAAKREKTKREALEAVHGESASKLRRAMMTGAGDLLQNAGAAVAGELAAADLPFAGEHAAIAVGALAQIVRPFTEPLGFMRLGTQPLQGAMDGGIAIARFKSARKRRGKPIAP